MDVSLAHQSHVGTTGYKTQYYDMVEAINHLRPDYIILYKRVCVSDLNYYAILVAKETLNFHNLCVTRSGGNGWRSA